MTSSWGESLLAQMQDVKASEGQCCDKVATLAEEVQSVKDSVAKITDSNIRESVATLAAEVAGLKASVAEIKELVGVTLAHCQNFRASSTSSSGGLSRPTSYDLDWTRCDAYIESASSVKEVVDDPEAGSA